MTSRCRGGFFGPHWQLPCERRAECGRHDPADRKAEHMVCQAPWRDVHDQFIPIGQAVELQQLPGQADLFMEAQAA